MGCFPGEESSWIIQHSIQGASGVISERLCFSGTCSLPSFTCKVLKWARRSCSGLVMVSWVWHGVLLMVCCGSVSSRACSFVFRSSGYTLCPRGLHQSSVYVVSQGVKPTKPSLGLHNYSLQLSTCWETGKRGNLPRQGILGKVSGAISVTLRLFGLGLQWCFSVWGWTWAATPAESAYARVPCPRAGAGRTLL